MSRKKKFFGPVHIPQVEAIAQAAAAQPFTLAEIGNTYCGPRDRFVVSLVVGYRDNEPYLPKTAKQAANAALQLTQDDGSPDTQWYVFDRQTGEMRCFFQHELENAWEEEIDEEEAQANGD